MKKIISFVSILMCAFLVFSCGEDETENPYAKKSSITIEKADVEDILQLSDDDKSHRDRAYPFDAEVEDLLGQRLC